MEHQKKYWNIDRQAGALLQALIHTHKPQHILEVGTSNGYSAILMGKVAKTYGGNIQTTEFFEERVQLARENIEKEGLSETVEVLQGDAMEILPSLVGAPEKLLGLTVKNPSVEEARTNLQPFDFVFLDANKEEYVAYFTYAIQLMPKGGIIIADNTISHRNKLSAFFEAVKNEPRANALELTIGTGLMVMTVTPQYP